jgi:hypothetical protein
VPHRFSDQLLGLAHDTHVGLDDVPFATRGFHIAQGLLRASRTVTVIDDDISPFAGEASCDRTADAPAAAGDECRLALQSHCHRYSMNEVLSRRQRMAKFRYGHSDDWAILICLHVHRRPVLTRD